MGTEVLILLYTYQFCDGVASKLINDIEESVTDDAIKVRETLLDQIDEIMALRDNYHASTEQLLMQDVLESINKTKMSNFSCPLREFSISKGSCN